MVPQPLLQVSEGKAAGGRRKSTMYIALFALQLCQFCGHSPFVALIRPRLALQCRCKVQP